MITLVTPGSKLMITVILFYWRNEFTQSEHQDKELKQTSKQKMFLSPLCWKGTALTKTTWQSSPCPLFPPSLPDETLSWTPNSIYISESPSFTPFLLTSFHSFSVNPQLHRGPTWSFPVFLIMRFSLILTQNLEGTMAERVPPLFL